MELDNYSVFICVAAPLFLMFFLVERRYRNTALALLLGLVLCMMAAELNTIFLKACNNDYLYVTTCITPVVEEVFKAIPIIFLYYVWTQERETLLGVAFGIGVGFAIMENLCIIISDPDTVNIVWGFVRGLCTGVMHALTTSIIAMALIFLGKQKGMRILAVFAALTTGIVYHATYNCLVQSDYSAVGLAIPIVTYCLILADTAIRTRAMKNTPEKFERFRRREGRASEGLKDGELSGRENGKASGEDAVATAVPAGGVAERANSK